MKISLNRFDLFRFERLISKLVKQSELPQIVSFAPCSDGLQLTAFCNGAVLTLTVPVSGNVESFTLPWATVKEFASKRSDSLNLDVNGKDVTLSWNTNGIPQSKTVQSQRPTDKLLPPLPDKTTVHSTALFDALVDAGRCVEPNNRQYSLGGICFRGAKSQIVSSDGKQALFQDGFSFPFESDVLCPVTKIFASKELRELGDTVKTGVTSDYVYFQIGVVDFWLKKIDGKFPTFDKFTDNIGGHTWLNLDPSDATFLAERLDTLPGKDGNHDPVFVKLNGGVAVRGFDTAKQTTTELRLAKSHYEGGSVLTPLNRNQLKTALDFGIKRIGFDPNAESPFIGYGDRKTFIVMPLDAKEPEVEASKVTVLASNNAKASVPPKVERPAKSDKPRTRATGKPNKVAVLDDAMKLRNNLRETLGSVNDLIRSIKSQRQKDRLLKSTMNSLRKLSL